MLVLLGVPVGDPERCTERDVGASEGSIFPSSLPPSRTDFRSSRRLVRPTVMGFGERMTRPKMGYSTKEMVSGASLLSTHPSMSTSHLAQHVIYDLAMLVLWAERCHSFFLKTPTTNSIKPAKPVYPISLNNPASQLAEIRGRIILCLNCWPR